MDISSLRFMFLFLPVFLITYLVARKEIRLILIVVASLIFLAWGSSKAAFWIGFILLASYGFGLFLQNSRDYKYKIAFGFWLGIGFNLAILLVFKVWTAYGEKIFTIPFFPNRIIPVFTSLTAPLGLSYVTFQAISYLVDVKRGTIKPERNLLRFSAYLLFFPKLISGPLSRYKSFADQINDVNPSFPIIANGIRRFFIGFIKRTLIANQVALIANSVFDLPQPSVLPQFAWLGLIAYTLQIYFDFSGYTDMALGLGMMVGIQLPENFNFPYVSQSVSEFWRRWHITLSAWFREYVFYPLERHRFKWMGQQINILIVFLLTGLWHGVKPTFILWGGWYGIFLVVESLGFGRWLNRAWRPIRHIYTLTAILIGWVFFRSSSLDYAFGFLHRLIGNSAGVLPMPFSQTAPLPFLDPSLLLALLLGVIFSFPISSFDIQWKEGAKKWEHRNRLISQIVTDLLLCFLYVLGLASALSQSFLPNIYASF